MRNLIRTIVFCFIWSFSYLHADGSVHDTQIALIAQNRRLLNEGIEQLKVARLVIDTEEFENDPVYRALLKNRELSELPIMDMAVKIRREINNDDTYLTTNQGRLQLLILNESLNKLNGHLNNLIPLMAESISLYQEDPERRAQSMVALAKTRIELDSRWKASIEMIYPSLAGQQSLNEDELSLALQALHEVFSFALKRHESKVLESQALKNLLDEYEDQALQKPLEDWLVENKSILANPSKLANKEFIQEIKLALQEQKNLRQILTQKINEVEAEMDELLAYAKLLSDDLAQKAESHPEVIYERLLEGLE